MLPATLALAGRHCLLVLLELNLCAAQSGVKRKRRCGFAVVEFRYLGVFALLQLVLDHVVERDRQLL
jgi:hypothetical protein